MTGNDEVLAFVGDPAKPVDVEIRDGVRLGESRGPTEFGEQSTVLTRLPAVDVADRNPIGYGKWDVTRTDLDPLAAQPPREAPPNCQWIHTSTLPKPLSALGPHRRDPGGYANQNGRTGATDNDQRLTTTKPTLIDQRAPRHRWESLPASARPEIGVRAVHGLRPTAPGR